MTDLYAKDSPVRISPLLWEDYQSNGGATASFNLSYDSYGLTQMFFREHMGGSEYGLFNTVRNLTGNESPFVSEEEANAEGGRYGLVFDGPIRRNALDIRVQAKRKELERKSIIARSKKGFLSGSAQLGASFVGALADPLNIASAFVPVVREANAARITAAIGLSRARLAIGAIEGSVGAAALEIPTLLLADRAQADYTMYDSITNIAFGGVIGGGLHFTGGYFLDKAKARELKLSSANLPERIERSGINLKETALRTSIADFVEGRPINVEPVLRTSSEFRAKGDDPFDPNILFREPKIAPQTPVFEEGLSIKPETQRYIDGIVDELKQSRGGEIIFREADGQGSTPDVIGGKGNVPDWYTNHNRSVIENNKLRKQQIRRNQKLPDNQKQEVLPSQSILTRKKVEAVAKKMKEGKKLGKVEKEIAEMLYDMAVEQRVSNARDIVNFREESALEAEKSINAIAQREMQDIIADKEGFSELTRTAEPVEKPADKIVDDLMSDIEDDLNLMDDFINGLNDDVKKALDIEGGRAELKLADEAIQEAESEFDKIVKFGLCIGRG